MTAFYSKYVSLCAKKHKSLSAVAEEIGLSRTSPNGWKKGKQPSDVTLEKLSQYFGIPVSELTRGKEKPAAESGELISDEDIDLWLGKQETEKLWEVMEKIQTMIKNRD